MTNSGSWYWEGNALKDLNILSTEYKLINKAGLQFRIDLNVTELVSHTHLFYNFSKKCQELLFDI